MQSNRFIFGKFVDDGAPLTASDMKEICDQSEVVRDELQRYPFDKVQRVMKSLSDLWRDKEGVYRKEAMARLPEESGYASSMIEKGLDVMAGLLDPDFLQKKLDTEFQGIPVLEGYKFDRSNGTAKQWQPLGVVLHVLAGNVFTGGVGSWIEGALTRNVSILKMSSSERVFLPIFMRSLLEVDHDGVLSRSTAVIDYSSRQTEVIDTLKQRVDGIVVWGGEQAVRAYRSDLPARTRFVVFGPKLSLSMITEKGLSERGRENLAKDLAMEMSIWDQNACTAPQICYVQGKENAYQLGEALANELEAIQPEIPTGAVDINTAVEIRKLRTLFEVNQLVGKSGFWSSGEDLTWSVFVDEDIDLQPSPLNRTIRVVAYEDLNQVVDQIRSYRGYVQTVGLECGTAERIGLASELAKFGVIRIVGLGQMAGGEIDDPHDGAYDLPQLVNMVLLRSKNDKERLIEPIDRMQQSERQPLLDARFRTLLKYARDSQYYGGVISEAEKRLGRPLDGLGDLQELPVLTRELMESHMPPQSDELLTLTQGYKGGYVSRSGGSTGKPKYSIYDSHDWEEMISHAEKLMLAAGLSKGDRLANCMIAGDLYGSFVSFDHIVARLGVTSFAFATKVTAENFVEVWRRFDLNAIQGVPAFVVPLLREAKTLEPSLRLEKFVFAGQALSKKDEEWLRDALGLSTISSIIGANDGGQIAYQCEYLQGAMHHVVDDFNYIEIVDQNDQPVPDGEPGRILITSLKKFAFPLIRYDIGDAARFVKHDCDCGRTSRTIEYLGRSDSIITVGFMNIDFNDVVKSLAAFAPTVVQLVARETSSAVEYLVVHLESPESDEISKDDVVKEIYAKIPTIQQRVDEGRLDRIEVEVFGVNGMPRNERSSKVKHFIDER